MHWNVFTAPLCISFLFLIASNVFFSRNRYKLAFSQSRIASYLFDGTGYALVNNMERRGKFGIVIRFDIAVRTVANNGILLLMVNGVNIATDFVPLDLYFFFFY